MKNSTLDCVSALCFLRLGQCVIGFSRVQRHIVPLSVQLYLLLKDLGDALQVGLHGLRRGQTVAAKNGFGEGLMLLPQKCGALV